MKFSDEEWAKVGVPVVERAKGEILADVRSGRVPATVASYSELHDYVDANGYGGAFESWHEGCTADDEFVAFWNRVQDEVNAWIEAGGLRGAG